MLRIRHLPSFNLDEFLPYQLAVAAGRTSREFARIYRERFGIGIAEWRVVAHLSQAGAVSVREIYEKVDMDKSRVSRAAQRLEEAGYVRKVVSARDRRLVELSLTERGREMIAEIAPLARDFERALAERLGPDAEAFRAGLMTLMTLEEERQI